MREKERVTGQPGPLWVVMASQPLAGWDCNHRPARPNISTYSRPTRVHIAAVALCSCFAYPMGYILLHGGPFLREAAGCA